MTYARQLGAVAAMSLALAGASLGAASADTGTDTTAASTVLAPGAPTATGSGTITCDSGVLGIGSSCTSISYPFSTSLPSGYTAAGLSVTVSDNAGDLLLQLLGADGTVLKTLDHTSAGTQTMTWTGTVSGAYSLKVSGEHPPVLGERKDAYTVVVGFDDLTAPTASDGSTPPPPPPPPSSGTTTPTPPGTGTLTSLPARTTANLAAKNLRIHHHGGHFAVDVTVANTGALPERRITVVATRNGRTLATKTVSKLPSQRAVRLTFRFTIRARRAAKPATYGVTIVSARRKAETTRADNTVSRRLD